MATSQKDESQNFTDMIIELDKSEIDPIRYHYGQNTAKKALEELLRDFPSLLEYKQKYYSLLSQYEILESKLRSLADLVDMYRS